MNGKKLLRITTAPISMRLLIEGQPAFMKGKGFDVILVSGHGADWEGIPRLEDYSVHKVDMARRINLPKDISALFALIRLFRRLKPDIVHSHTPKAGLLGMLAAKITGVPVRIHTVAGLPLMESKGITRSVLVWMERLTYACASGVYPNSYHLKDFILAHGFTRPAKARVIAGGSSNGIDTVRFERTAALQAAGESVRKSLGIPAGALVLLFVGRIVRDKGIGELVRAFDRICGNYPEIRLLLAGPDEKDQDPIDRDTRTAMERNDRIVHVGFQADVRPYLSLADVLVFPSYREGFPNVPMQAGCFGLPSIVTDINGCNEIITDGVNGLIIPPKDEKAVALAMEKMITDEPFRSRCAAAARQRILEKYRQSVVWEALYEEYRRLLAVDPLQ